MDLLLNNGMTTTIDDEDYPLLAGLKLRYLGGYAVSYENRQLNPVHRIVMHAPKHLMVDHINGNPLDNRKSNLRLVTNSQNLMNQKPRANTTSIYRGVAWNKKSRKWEAIVTSQSHGRIYLGLFKNEKDAARAWNEKAKEVHGEFARLNDI